MTMINRRHALLLGGLTLSAGAFLSRQPAAAAGVGPPAEDLAAIRAMSGAFHVRFDTRETTPFVADYDPQDPSISQGDEVVRIIEDTGRTIRLQHILVVSQGGRTFTIRHWRQDWTYEPESLLAYAGSDTWRLIPLAPEARAGRWAQTVWNTDDSPRYGALGEWRHDHGVSRWTGDRALRPMARRDAVSQKPYTHYEGVNRHALTPSGWVHEQDNAKIGPHEGLPAIYVHEAVINSYSRASDFDVAAADAYLEQTQAYWDAVRRLWDGAISGGRGLWLKEAPQTGSAAGPPLMALADQFAEGRIALGEAIAQAQQIIAQTSRAPEA